VTGGAVAMKTLGFLKGVVKTAENTVAVKAKSAVQKHISHPFTSMAFNVFGGTA